MIYKSRVNSNLGLEELSIGSRDLLYRSMDGGDYVHRVCGMCTPNVCRIRER